MIKPASTVAAAVILSLAAGGAASAHAYDVGPLHIDHPWIRATPNGAPTAAGYLTVANHGKTTERLLGGSTPLAQSIEPHTMSMSGGIMRMRLAPEGFPIAPGTTLVLAPGGNHLMLIAPTRTLKAGENVPATLRFAHAGSVKVDFAVRAGEEGPNAPTGRMPMQ